MKRILIAFVALSLCAPLLRAQSVSFLNIDTDPAAVGMANAGVAMTADAFSENITECLNAGMNGHIAKPVDIKLVVKEIRRIREGRKLS